MVLCTAGNIQCGMGLCIDLESFYRQLTFLRAKTSRHYGEWKEYLHLWSQHFHACDIINFLLNNRFRYVVLLAFDNRLLKCWRNHNNLLCYLNKRNITQQIGSRIRQTLQRKDDGKQLKPAQPDEYCKERKQRQNPC